MIKRPYEQLSDMDIVSLCVWREARGALELAKCGVAWVIKRRKFHPSWWGKTYSQVVLAPKQFSSFNAGDPNERNWPSDNDPIWRDCTGIVNGVLVGRIPDPTSGAVYYHDISVMPPWARQYELTLTVGRLLFYKEIDITHASA